MPRSYRKPTAVASAATYTGGRAHFTPGCWRPDPPTGTVAIPEGPQQPRKLIGPETVSDRDGRPRDPRTAANLADRAGALKPRRWTPPV